MKVEIKIVYFSNFVVNFKVLKGIVHCPAAKEKGQESGVSRKTLPSYTVADVFRYTQKAIISYFIFLQPVTGFRDLKRFSLS
jgi:hypothetical protein